VPNETIDEIVASAAEARKQLGKLEHQLQGEIDRIDFIAFEEKRLLNERERKQRRQLRSSQIQVRDAFTQLAFVTIQRLDNSDEVLRLKQRIETIKETLADDLERLKKIERIAETVAQVSDTVADVVAKLVEKAADLAL
jgi:hypothetical protein